MLHSEWIFRLAFAATIAFLMATIWLLLRQLGMPASLSPSALSEWLAGQGMLGPVFLMLMMILAVVVGPIPTLPVSAASGLVYGVFAGTAIAVLGALAGAVIAFYLARILGRDVIRRKLDNIPVFSVDGSQRFLFVAVLLTRLIPLFSFALVSYAAGVTVIRLWRFALASAIGMLPMTFVFAGLGQTFELSPVVTVVAAVAVLLVMSALPFYISRRPHSPVARWLHLDNCPGRSGQR